MRLARSPSTETLLLYSSERMTIGSRTSRFMSAMRFASMESAGPNDPQSPFVTSGVRIGTPAVTSRGLVEEDMKVLAHLIGCAAKDFEGTKEYVRAEVTKLCEKYPLY